AYKRRRLLFQIKWMVFGLLVALMVGGASWIFTVNAEWFRNAGEAAAWSASGAVAVVTWVTWVIILGVGVLPAWHAGQVKNLDGLTVKASQARKDSWAAVRSLVANYLKETKGKLNGR